MKANVLIALYKKHLNKNIELEQENIKLKRENENLREVLKLCLYYLEKEGIKVSYWANGIEVKINTLIKDETKND